jgi:asparagine synthase (glutamine-hydrolysing)
MCGIAGFFNIAKSSFSVDRILLERMQESLAHRGPNGYRIWASDAHGLGIAHRRLSIMDLSEAGFQPMIDDEQTVLVCCNGEIYNHPHLKKELEELGYVYRSNSDTETILHAYKAWGIASLDRLDGMFATIIFDFIKQELYLIRDRMGIKPLYFSLQGGVLSFASEIKALWQLPWITRQIKHDAAYHYLTYLATPAPMTLYEGIYKLPASFYLKVDQYKEVTFHEWYTPLKPAMRYDAQLLRDESFCVEKIRGLLRNAVKQQMMSDVPFGVFLSGGIDSSLNVALMAEVIDQINTFTIAFADGPEYNELTWARTIAQRFNTTHHEMVITEKEAFNFFQDMVYFQDEPLGDCVCIPLYYVAKLLKDAGVTVVQVGEGSDELFCGYPLYANYLTMQRPWHLTQTYLPAFARRACYGLAQRVFPQSSTKLALLDNWAHDRALFWGGATVFSEGWKRSFSATPPYALQHDSVVEAIYPGFSQGYDSYAMVAYHNARLYAQDPAAHFYKSMTYIELKHRLPELLLMRVDKMAMATSVEGRVPFLDHHLVEFALQIPQELKYKHGMTKYILKKACEGILPPEIIYRKKIGFAAPTTRWFKQGTYFRPYFRELLHNPNNSFKEYFDVTVIEQMFKKNQESPRVDYSYQLWALQNLLAYGMHV